jgi:hypothetical protein
MPQGAVLKRFRPRLPQWCGPKVLLGHLRLNLDLYHAQIGEGNLVQPVERALPLVGEIQVADVPGRCEPGTGEIHCPAVAVAVAVAVAAALRFRAAFAVRP